jgi:hypothetical protein
MNILPRVLLIASLATSVSSGQEVRMDFRNSHTLNDIVGLESMKLFQTSENGDKSYFSKNSKIIISLPSGQKIVTRTQSLNVQAKADGTLIYVRIFGPIMPLDEVYQASKTLYSAFSIPHDRLEKWKPEAEVAGHDAKSVSSAQSAYYPHLFIEILDSMNRFYPWTISMSLGWIDENPVKHTEAWGRENNPKPPPGLEVVSLEAPSGKTYDRADAWVESNRRQDELDKKLGQVRGPDGQLIRGPQDLPKERVEKPRSSAAVEPTDVITEKSNPFPWWIIVSSIGILVFALTIWLQRGNSKSDS